MFKYAVKDEHKVIYMFINLTTGTNHVVVNYFDCTRKSVYADLPYNRRNNLVTYSYNLLQFFE